MNNISYQCYVCDIIQAIAIRNGVDVSDRWYDTINTNRDTRSEAEIALDKFFSEVK